MLKHKKCNKSLVLFAKIFATGIMSFCGVVSETAMNVTFPTLMDEFNIGTSTVQWITTGYLLILALVVTMSSYLKRNFQSRSLFLTSIFCFILATLVCFSSTSFWILIVGRMVQGIGTGIALPLMFNIIINESPREKIGMFMGLGMLVTAVAPAVGPVLGGYIVEFFGWRYIFLSLLPLLVLSLFLGWFLIKPQKVEKSSNFHIVDYSLIVIGYSSFIVAMVSASSSGWISISVISLIFISLVAILLFGIKSRNQLSPLLRIEVLKYGKFVASLAVILIGQFSVLALGYIMPNYSQIVNGTGAFQAGLLLVPGCIVGACLSPISGKILDRYGARLPITAGYGFMLLSLIMFFTFAKEMTVSLFYVFYVVFTIGQGLGCGNAMTFGLGNLPKDLSADGNALINSLQQLAGAMGTAVASTIVASSQKSAIIRDFRETTAYGSQNALLLLAIIMLCAFIASICMTSQNKTNKISL